MVVDSLLLESVDLRRLGGPTGGNDVPGDRFDRRQAAPRQKHLGPLGPEGACDSAADPASGSVDHRNLVLQQHLGFPWIFTRFGPSGGTSYTAGSYLCMVMTALRRTDSPRRRSCCPAFHRQCRSWSCEGWRRAVILV